MIVEKSLLAGSLDAYGVSVPDYKMVTGDRPFVGADRMRVSRTLQSLTYGALDAMGIPRFEVPAEYAAAIIATFVHPVNLLVACVFCDRLQPSDGVLGDGDGELTSPQELFALVVQFLEDPGVSSKAKEQFNKRVGLAQTRTTEDAG